ncbi:cyanophycin metabolism-associated DUF1854 family protein [Duganella qianjiadongensis]|uniref:DUF1854 domain-containing protein n=1 Tax=Duganella qianjiadongensis TaxID=2692176 RepID=A0ABW9VF77_9BURK|nr:DUF1854 domain-containing protein [Duganella qianjiadongensis]MYM38271.1 DUF1854 domain-containing protein [Duganella qianjiadongensis]
MTTQFKLTRNSYGKLILTTPEGDVHEGVAPVRAFPVQAPEDGISLVNTDGKEVAWIDRIEDLDAQAGALVREELAGREFMPEISRIHSVSSYATPCTWTVTTDRGETEFVLRGEEDIRRLTVDTLLISDIHGIHFLVRDLRELDKHSKKILDRFL